MRMMIKATCFNVLLVFAASALLYNEAGAGERGRRGSDYSQFDNDGSGLLDAINREHGAPPSTGFSGVGTGPLGYQEVNPYDPDKWFRDEVGMIDAINKDHGKPYRAPQPNVGTGPTGRQEVNPYDPHKWDYDEAGMIDAINKDHSPAYRNRRRSQTIHQPQPQVNNQPQAQEVYQYEPAYEGQTPTFIDGYPPLYRAK